MSRRKAVSFVFTLIFICTGFFTFGVMPVSALSNPNLALNKTVTSSSSYEGSGWGQTMVVDGLRTTDGTSSGWSSWSNLSVNHTEWVQIDLGSSQTIREIDLWPRADGTVPGRGFPIDFSVQVSTDNINWTTYHLERGHSNSGGGVTSLAPQYPASSATARYIKVQGTNLDNLGGNYLMQFAEIEAYSYSTYVNPYNIAAGKTVTATSSDETNGYSASDLTDNVTWAEPWSPGYRSTSNTGVNHTEIVTIDLGSNHSVMDFVLYSGSNNQGFPINFDIQYSTDNVNWTVAVRRINYPDPGWLRQSFPITSVTARYIRVVGWNLQNIPSEGYRMKLSDIEVYEGTQTMPSLPSVDYVMSTVTGSSAPVIDKNNAGASDNTYGFETGQVIKLTDGTYHMVVNELYSVTDMWMPTRAANWKSTDGNTWTRVGRVSQIPIDNWDPRIENWDPQWYYNTAESKWDITYMGGQVFRTVSNNSGDAGIDGPYTESASTLTPYASPSTKYWADHRGNGDSFSNAFTIGSKLYAFVGGGDTDWNVGLYSADSIGGPWSEDTTKVSPDLRKAENPVVTKLDDGTYFAVFDDLNNGAKTIGYAYSTDGLHWTQKIMNMTVDWADTNGPVNSIRTPMSLIKESDGNYTVYFTAKNASYNYWEVGKVKVSITKYNQAPRSSAVASSTTSGWPASSAIDGNKDSAWSSAWSTSQTGKEWIYTDLGANYSVKRARLKPRTYGGAAYAFPVDFKIQYSTNGKTWKDVPGQNYTNYALPGDDSDQVFTFGSAVTARYIRVYATRFGYDPNGYYFMQLAEINADIIKGFNKLD